ncbi:MAG: ABC transporter substrate-binding protein [Bacteroidetes bacterium MED-G13]|nr:MAG: ABC transporter substrate-binding protein [Bacteroidetes bacterium MED-G13]
MKFRKEVKVGVLAVIGILMSVFSYNYLKGFNLFEKNRSFKIIYEKVDGLSVSNPVTLNGFKIGNVKKINFNPDNTKELIVDIIIENDVIFSKSSYAELYETGLIGGKAIAIIPDYSDDSVALDGDYLKGSIKPGLTELVNQILPQVQLQLEIVMKNAEIVLENINSLFDAETKAQLKSSVDDFSNLTNQLSETSNAISKLILENSQNISLSVENIRLSSERISDISKSLSPKTIKDITTNLDSVLSNLKNISKNLNSGSGTFGKLINDDSVYQNLDSTINELKVLIEDVRNNPNKYINFSVIGRKYKEKSQK